MFPRSLPPEVPWYWPTILTPRLVIRQPHAGDLRSLHGALNSPGVRDYFGRTAVEPLRQTEHYFTEFLLGNYAAHTGLYPLILDREGERQVRGVVGLTRFEWQHRHAEIGLWLSSDCWGQGLAVEAISGLLGWAFAELPLERVTALVEPDNTRSCRAFVKAGGSYEGCLARRLFRNGQMRDVNVYGFFREAGDEDEATSRSSQSPR